MTWQCALVAQKFIHDLGCIKNSMAKRTKDLILTLYSTLGKPHLECFIELWGPQPRKNDTLGAGPEEGHKNRELQHFYEDRLKAEFILEKRRLQGDLAAFEYLKGAYRN